MSNGIDLRELVRAHRQATRTATSPIKSKSVVFDRAHSKRVFDFLVDADDWLSNSAHSEDTFVFFASLTILLLSFDAGRSCDEPFDLTRESFPSLAIGDFLVSLEACESWTFEALEDPTGLLDFALTTASGMSSSS